MWTKSVAVLNPYEAVSKSRTGNEQKDHSTKEEKSK